MMLLLHLLFSRKPIKRKFRRPLRRESYTINEVHKIAEVLEAFVVESLRLVSYARRQLYCDHHGTQTSITLVDQRNMCIMGRCRILHCRLMNYPGIISTTEVVVIVHHPIGI